MRMHRVAIGMPGVHQQVATGVMGILVVLMQPQTGVLLRSGGVDSFVYFISTDLSRLTGCRLTNEELLRGVKTAWDRGWKQVKLYFMIGRPRGPPCSALLCSALLAAAHSRCHT